MILVEIPKKSYKKGRKNDSFEGEGKPRPMSEATALERLFKSGHLHIKMSIIFIIQIFDFHFNILNVHMSLLSTSIIDVHIHIPKFHTPRRSISTSKTLIVMSLISLSTAMSSISTFMFKMFVQMTLTISRSSWEMIMMLINRDFFKGDKRATWRRVDHNGGGKMSGQKVP